MFLDDDTPNTRMKDAQSKQFLHHDAHHESMFERILASRDPRNVSRKFFAIAHSLCLCIQSELPQYRAVASGSRLLCAIPRAGWRCLLVAARVTSNTTKRYMQWNRVTELSTMLVKSTLGVGYIVGVELHVSFFQDGHALRIGLPNVFLSSDV